MLPLLACDVRVLDEARENYQLNSHYYGKGTLKYFYNFDWRNLSVSLSLTHFSSLSDPLFQ